MNPTPPFDVEYFCLRSQSWRSSGPPIANWELAKQTAVIHANQRQRQTRVLDVFDRTVFFWPPNQR